MSQQPIPDIYDLFIIGGGVNGCGIARDAAGRGLSVVLAEQNDLAQGTSSASTKLFHGGLRYLEYFEFRLVREALQEREILLKAMPHIAWPMRFVLPYSPDMRFDSQTPTSKLLATLMPWMSGKRPAWLIRMGLFLYDHLGKRGILPPTHKLNLSENPVGLPLKSAFKLAYEYSDCWVQDARLVVLNARDAEMRGAKILTRTKVIAAKRHDNIWHVTLDHHGQIMEFRARGLINAAGPWVQNIIQNVLSLPSTEGVRLVRGSHIVTPKLYDHDKCYFFQGRDGRIIFTIPYEQDYTLIGTTDQDHRGTPEEAECSPEEQSYLCEFASQYFKKTITLTDIIWTYSGVRPLYNDGAKNATAATRDYVLSVHDQLGQAPVLHIFGGKITTYRRLAESAMAKLSPYFPNLGKNWTAGQPLPGGDFTFDDRAKLQKSLEGTYPYLNSAWARRLISSYGTDTFLWLNKTKSLTDLGQNFGHTLYEAEVIWMLEQEYAQTAEDILWRRSKLGLKFSQSQIDKLKHYISHRSGSQPLN